MGGGALPRVGTNRLGPTAPARVLSRLTELTDREPQWLDNPACQICSTKFTLQIRKHHCRHCGRVACSKCVPKDRKLALPKFRLEKPERLCELCYDALAPLA